MPQLTGERVRLSAVQCADVQQVLDYYQRNRQFLQPWEPLRDAHFYTHEFWMTELAAREQRLTEGTGISFGVFHQHSNELIGFCNFSNIVRGVFQACHLGYALDQRFEGQGFMSEALALGIGYVFEQLHLHRVMANYMPANQRSAAVLARLGFVREGYASRYLKINGVWEDHILTALINPDPTL